MFYRFRNERGPTVLSVVCLMRVLILRLESNPAEDPHTCVPATMLREKKDCHDAGFIDRAEM